MEPNLEINMLHNGRRADYTRFSNGTRVKSDRKVSDESNVGGKSEKTTLNL